MGVRVQEYVGVAPYAPEALCLYAPIAWEPSYTPGPYRRGFSLLPCLTRGGSALICGDHLPYSPIYAGLCPIHAGKNPLLAEKSLKKLEKKFVTKGAQNTYSLKSLGKLYNWC